MRSEDNKRIVHFSESDLRRVNYTTFFHMDDDNNRLPMESFSMPDDGRGNTCIEAVGTFDQNNPFERKNYLVYNTPNRKCGPPTLIYSTSLDVELLEQSFNEPPCGENQSCENKEAFPQNVIHGYVESLAQFYAETIWSLDQSKFIVGAKTIFFSDGEQRDDVYVSYENEELLEARKLHKEWEKASICRMLPTEQSVRLADESSFLFFRCYEGAPWNDLPWVSAVEIFFDRPKYNGELAKLPEPPNPSGLTFFEVYDMENDGVVDLFYGGFDDDLGGSLNLSYQSAALAYFDQFLTDGGYDRHLYEVYTGRPEEVYLKAGDYVPEGWPLFRRNASSEIVFSDVEGCVTEIVDWPEINLFKILVEPCEQ